MKTYKEFAEKFVREAMENGVCFLVVNWQDALGVCQLLNTFTINGNSIAMCGEFADEAYFDIESVKTYDGNMLISLFESGELICEKALENEMAYIEGKYYVEESALPVYVPKCCDITTFKVESDIFDNVF